MKESRQPSQDPGKSVLLSSLIVATLALSRYHIALAEQANAKAVQDIKMAQLIQSQRVGNSIYNNCLQTVDNSVIHNFV